MLHRCPREWIERPVGWMPDDASLASGGSHPIVMAETSSAYPFRYHRLAAALPIAIGMMAQSADFPLKPHDISRAARGTFNAAMTIGGWRP